MRITEADEQAQRKVANDIDHHLRVVVNLRQRSNSLVNINRLPPELLAEIFGFCQDGLWDVLEHQNPKYGRIAPPLRWVYLSAVCHHWRQVAVQMPRLWARVNLDYPSFARNLSMALVKRAPLHLTATEWSSQQTVLVNDIFLNIDHVHSINWIFNDTSSHLGLNTIPAMTTPLRSIRITRKKGLPLTQITASIFKECIFPSIQKLELENCICILPACLLGPTLKHLTLQTDASQTIDFVTLTNSLSRMSQLEVLHLQGVSFDKTGGEHASNVQKLLLPNLRQLVVNPPHNSYQDYFSFLRTLELPAEVHIHLKFTNTMVDKDLRTLLCITLELFHPLISRTLALCDTGYTFVIGLWNDVVSPEILDKLEPAPHSGLWLHAKDQTNSIVWDEFLHVLDLHRVESIHFGDPNPWNNDRRHWKRLLRTPDALKTLSLKGEVACTVVDILCSHGVKVIRRKAGNTVSKPLAPELKTIQFLDLTWRGSDEARCGEEGAFMESLLDLLSKRAKDGIPLEKLVIKRCMNLDDDTVGALDEKVSVDWDGDIIPEDDSGDYLGSYDHYGSGYLDDDFMEYYGGY